MGSAEGADRPFVETSIARLMLARMEVTHEERGISVVSGPWGIGKTTAIDRFAAENEFSCAVMKIEPGATKKGVSPIAVLQHAIEAVRHLMGKERHASSTAYWQLRSMLFNALDDHFRQSFDVRGPEWKDEGTGEQPYFTFIIDEAQYLSKESIEVLRFWNDSDRCSTPVPVGLVFIGNNEFALKEDANGSSILSGAVRSRALFIDQLQYAHVSDLDLTLFMQSRGISDAGAIRAFIAHFDGSAVKRDLRSAERLVAIFKRRAAGQPVTAATVRSVLSPA